MPLARAAQEPANESDMPNTDHAPARPLQSSHTKAQSDAKTPRDKHPELSAPIVDLSLEVRIARAEQAVIRRDAQVLGGARRIVDMLGSKRGAALRWAGIAGAGAAACGLGYASYRAWHERRDFPSRAAPSPSGAKATRMAATVAAFTRSALSWVVKLPDHSRESGSWWGLLRTALRAGARAERSGAPSGEPVTSARESGDHF